MPRKILLCLAATLALAGCKRDRCAGRACRADANR